MTTAGNFEMDPPASALNFSTQLEQWFTLLFFFSNEHNRVSLPYTKVEVTNWEGLNLFIKMKVAICNKKRFVYLLSI